MTMAAEQELLERYLDVIPDVEGTLFEGYWQGAASGELRLPHCDSCGAIHWYPLHACPKCGGSWSWVAIRPDATLFTYTVIHWPLAPAFERRRGEIVALVTPDEAPNVRLVTNLVDIEEPVIGMPLTARFVKVDDSRGIPLFTAAK
jgi:uncharacterized protein